tara:strand:+ start:2166 stop:2870 length:705 start_codon:yes stop_codon:yes gene_type:complete
MANVKISELTPLGIVDTSAILIPVVDTTDLTQADSGSTKRITAQSLSDLTATDIQGYLALLSDFYYSGTATSHELAITDVNVWQDVVMTVHPSGTSDNRPTSMKTAKAVGTSGDGSVGNPIKFLLEGLNVKSSATLRASLSFVPDEDGGRLDSRMYVERHSAATPSEDFPIDAAGLSMESGADEDYPHLVAVQFFVGDTINTNGVDDAGKIRFQIKSDVTGTVKMRELALFIQL